MLSVVSKSVANESEVGNQIVTPLAKEVVIDIDQVKGEEKLH